jgi:hypothetical protein
MIIFSLESILTVIPVHVGLSIIILCALLYIDEANTNPAIKTTIIQKKIFNFVKKLIFDFICFCGTSVVCFLLESELLDFSIVFSVIIV